MSLNQNPPILNVTDPLFSIPLSERLCMPWLDAAGDGSEHGLGAELNGCLEGACAMAEEETALWKPLVLLIPLRLGLSDINEAYIETLKVRKPPSKERLSSTSNDQLQML